MAEPGLLRPTGRRAVLVGVDQALSSGTNFVTALAATSMLTAAEFGAYALGGSLFGLALAGGRLTSAERLTVFRARGEVAIITMSVVAAAAGAIVSCVLLWLVVGDPVVLAWALASLPVLLQDRLRFVALSSRIPAAIAGDALWFVLSVAVWILVSSSGISGPVGALLITSVPPAVSLLVLGVLVRRNVAAQLEQDLRASVSELPYVLDSWIQIAAVFVGLAMVGAVGSLATVGQARALMLVFQPFVSISYAGRLLVLGSADERAIQRWPTLSSAACAVYSLIAAVVLIAIDGSTDELSDVWSFSVTAFVLMAVAQCARSFHQSVADLQRRTMPRRLVRSRGVFAVVLVVATLPLVARYGLDGFALSWALAYAAGAWMVRPARAMPAPCRDDR